MSDAPEHPGLILRREVLEPLHGNVNRLATCLSMKWQHLNDVVHGKNNLSPTLGKSPIFFSLNNHATSLFSRPLR